MVGNVEHFLGILVDRFYVEPLVERDHARGEIAENRFEIRIGVFQLLLLATDDLGGLGELAGHGVECLREHAEFVAAFYRVQFGEIALGDRARRFGECRERSREPLREKERKRNRREQGKQHGQREREGKQLLQAFALESKSLVIADAGFNARCVEGETFGSRLDEL